MLTNRQKLILGAIVEDYVRSAEPVGSRTLSKHGSLHFSAATIRNEMADLEEMGLLDQPHTSSGRIPSQKGYRFYVDHLVSQSDLDPEIYAALREVFVQKISEVERITEQTAVVLSQLTHYTSIVVRPRVNAGKIHHVQLVPLTPESAVLLLVTDTGHVENRQVRISSEVQMADIVRMVNILNDRLRDVPLYRLQSSLHREIGLQMSNAISKYEDAIAILDDLFRGETSNDERVFVGGSTNILAQPEFRDVDKVRPLLQMLERSDMAMSVLPIGGGVQVRIGNENLDPTLQECSVVSATYTVNGIPAGTVGILGPTRMNYARMMRILDYVAKGLSKMMAEGTHGL